MENVMIITGAAAGGTHTVLSYIYRQYLILCFAAGMGHMPYSALSISSICISRFSVTK
jgi:hypothetical protein